MKKTAMNLGIISVRMVTTFFLLMMNLKDIIMNEDLFKTLGDMFRPCNSEAFLTIEPPNIFKGAGNDYNVRVGKCKKRSKTTGFDAMKLSKIVEAETLIDAFTMTKYRGRPFVLSRQIVMAILCNRNHKSLSEIGAIFGKDHATVLHAKKTISNLCETNKDFRELYTRIITRVKNEL